MILGPEVQRAKGPKCLEYSGSSGSEAQRHKVFFAGLGEQDLRDKGAKGQRAKVFLQDLGLMILGTKAIG